MYTLHADLSAWIVLVSQSCSPPVVIERPDLPFVAKHVCGAIYDSVTCQDDMADFAFGLYGRWMEQEGESIIAMAPSLHDEDISKDQ